MNSSLFGTPRTQAITTCCFGSVVISQKRGLRREGSSTDLLLSFTQSAAKETRISCVNYFKNPRLYRDIELHEINISRPLRESAFTNTHNKIDSKELLGEEGVEDIQQIWQNKTSWEKCISKEIFGKNICSSLCAA